MIEGTVLYAACGFDFEGGIAYYLYARPTKKGTWERLTIGGMKIAELRSMGIDVVKTKIRFPSRQEKSGTRTVWLACFVTRKNAVVLYGEATSHAKAWFRLQDALRANEADLKKRGYCVVRATLEPE